MHFCQPPQGLLWKAIAMGKNYVNGKIFFEKRCKKYLESEDAIHTAVLTLKGSFEGQVTDGDLEARIGSVAGLRRPTPPELVTWLPLLNNEVTEKSRTSDDLYT